MIKTKNNFKYLLQLFKINAMTQTQYKAWFYADIVRSLIIITVSYFLWLAIANSSTDGTLGFESANDLTSYIILAILVANIGTGNPYYVRDILTGNFSVHFVKPYNLFLKDAILALYSNFLFFITSLLPVYLFAVFFLDLKTPDQIETYFGFLLLLASGCIFMLSFQTFFGLFVILVTNAWGLTQFKNLIIMFFSGSILPLTLFPDVLKSIANILPFRSTVSMPIAYYLTPSTSMLIDTLILQVIWTIIMIIATYLTWTFVVRKRVVVMGG